MFERLLLPCFLCVNCPFMLTLFGQGNHRRLRIEAAPFPKIYMVNCRRFLPVQVKITSYVCFFSFGFFFCTFLWSETTLTPISISICRVCFEISPKFIYNQRPAHMLPQIALAELGKAWNGVLQTTYYSHYNVVSIIWNIDSKDSENTIFY